MIAVVAFGALILGVSSIPATRMPSAPELWRWDKVIHGLEYAIAALLLMRALRPTKLSSLWRVLACIVLCGLFAWLDETYQSTVPGRDSSFYDMIADITGASVASVASALFYRRRLQAHTNQKKE